MPPNAPGERRPRPSQPNWLGRSFRERGDENTLWFASAATILADTVDFAGGIGGEVRLVAT